MKKFTWQKALLILASIGIVLILTFSYVQRKSSDKMISEFGKYQGYSEPVYDGTQRTSDYLTLSDGTRLAYDLIIPTRNGVPAQERLPVLFKYTPYGRTWTIFDKNGKFLLGDFVDLPTAIILRIRYWMAGERGRIMDPLWRDRWLGPVVKHGYIVLSVDRPGTGASFPSPTPGSMETAAKFQDEIIDWIAAQPWSDGNVAMYGDSFQAMVQFAAASTNNPHLKAILPAASNIEIYQAVEYPGGIYNLAFNSLFKSSVSILDELATPVDSDPDGALLAQARAARGNASLTSITQIAQQCPYIDSSSAGIKPWDGMNLYQFVERINRAGTPVYLTVGWYDIFTADMFYWYNSLSVPRRLTVRPTDHSQVSANLADLSYGTEALRWLDYWLKGIDNGIMDEAPIHYYLQDGPDKGTWQSSDRWPLAAQEMTPYYLAASNGSAKDGRLAPDSPLAASAADAYTVDYTTTSGTKTRWVAVEERHAYPDMRANDAKALAYTTAPLESPMVVTGHPLVDLWLSTTASDLDVFVYLEAVDSQGKSTYVTEGELRASHRKLSQAPFNNFGLPYHSHLQGDQQPVPSGEPFELTFSLLPTAYRFPAGSRLRLTVAFADAGNFDTPVLAPAPSLQLLREAGHASSIELPILPGL